MIAKTLMFLVAVGACLSENTENPLAGVDPNTLSCDPAGQIFLLLPHFSDCTKFFMCANGEEVEFTCSGGLIFDFELQTCNWDWATTCSLRTEENEVEGSGEEIEGSGEESGDFEWAAFHEDLQQSEPIISGFTDLDRLPAKVPKFTAILDCNSAAGAARQVPYKGDCQRYWRCIDGMPQSLYCSDGLFFNEKSQQCDFETNVGCNVNHEEELKGEFIMYE